MAFAAALATFAGCTTTADYTMGEELAPGNQQMVVRHRLYSGGMLKETDREDTPCKVFESRLYKTDSVAAAKLGNLYLGLQKDSRFGVRKLGFTSQYLFMEAVNDTTGFGFRPVYDSAVFRFAVDTFAGDTTKPVKYHVYELTEDLVNEESEDTLFYLSFDPRKAGRVAPDAQPIFTFEFPAPDKGVYTTSTSVRMRETSATKKFIERLFCTDPENIVWNGMAVKNIEAYSSDSAFIHNFKGLYVEAADDMPEGEGSVFSFSPASTGFEVFGRNRSNGADTQIMADTIDMLYYFKDSYATKYGNVWVQSARHDYSNTEFAEHPFDESQTVRPEVKLGYVDGCGGVITELTFTDEFLYSLRNINGGGENLSGEVGLRLQQDRPHSDGRDAQRVDAATGHVHQLQEAHPRGRLHVHAGEQRHAPYVQRLRQPQLGLLRNEHILLCAVARERAAEAGGRTRRQRRFRETHTAAHDLSRPERIRPIHIHAYGGAGRRVRGESRRHTGGTDLYVSEIGNPEECDEPKFSGLGFVVLDETTYPITPCRKI